MDWEESKGVASGEVKLPAAQSHGELWSINSEAESVPS